MGSGKGSRARGGGGGGLRGCLHLPDRVSPHMGPCREVQYGTDIGFSGSTNFRRSIPHSKGRRGQGGGGFLRNVKSWGFA